MIFLPYLLNYSQTAKTTLLHELGDPTIARGLITFLIAVAAVGIATILTIYVVTTDRSTVKDHFGYGNEVLTAVIGILGTIVGFYFGTTTKEPSQQPSTTTTQQRSPTTVTQQSPTAIIVSDVVVSPEQAKKGSPIKLSFDISGGQAPYDYTINFSPKVIKPVPGDTKDGKAVSKEVPVPNVAELSKSLEVTIEVTDAVKNTYKTQPKRIDIVP